MMVAPHSSNCTQHHTIAMLFVGHGGRAKEVEQPIPVSISSTAQAVEEPSSKDATRAMRRTGSATPFPSTVHVNILADGAVISEPFFSKWYWIEYFFLQVLTLDQTSPFGHRTHAAGQQLPACNKSVSMSHIWM
jgi:hypothetical protein